jgi:hypothetical protein
VFKPVLHCCVDVGPGTACKLPSAATSGCEACIYFLETHEANSKASILTFLLLLATA